MSIWPQVWAVVLVVGLTMFAGLAIVVTIGGFFDVKAMFRQLGRQHEAGKEEGKDEG